MFPFAEEQAALCRDRLVIRSVKPMENKKRKKATSRGQKVKLSVKRSYTGENWHIWKSHAWRLNLVSELRNNTATSYSHKVRGHFKHSI